MNQADVKVSFYLKKSEADAKGNCPVLARLNVGKYSEAAFSVKMSVPHRMWYRHFHTEYGTDNGILNVLCF